MIVEKCALMDKQGIFFQDFNGKEPFYGHHTKALQTIFDIDNNPENGSF
jgi:hypothetical protein